MNESDARCALLVRAYETLPAAQTTDRWSEDDRGWATQAALHAEGEHASAEVFIARRSRLAAERICSRDGAARQALRALTWRPWIVWTLALLAFAAGIATDSIGPARRINVLAPPLLALIAWNLLIYAALLARAATRFAGAGSPRPGPLARRIAQAVASVRGIEHLRPPLPAFARDWTIASAPLTMSRTALMLHWAAAALAAGALLGMYVRGFAFEYLAGWESTFLEASSVRAMLSIVLGPAAAISGIALPDETALAAIRSSVSPGENAARWIHLYALTVALIVLAPRALLAFREFLAVRRLADVFPLPLDDGYFQAIARAQQGAAATIRIVPYSHRPGPQAALGLNDLMGRVFGSRTELTVSQAVAFGGEDALEPDLLPAEPAALVAALFPLTATPERENHGRFLEALAARTPPSTPLAILIDESGFLRRFDASGAAGSARRDERRAAWRRMLDAIGREPLFADLERCDFADAERALRAVIDHCGERAARA